MALLAEDDTISQAPVTNLFAAATGPEPVQGRRFLRAAVLTGAVLLDVGLAAWAFMSIRLAFMLLHMHG